MPSLRPRKTIEEQAIKRRAPRQARAREKVELILEAAIWLLERNGIEAFTTNALAETAGVSIGTLYQYFGDKDAVLAALADREMAGLSASLLASLQGTPPAKPGERIREIFHAVLSTYGGRRRAHRLVMVHAMGQGAGGRLGPLFSRLIELFTAHGVAGPGQGATPLSTAEAFVLTHAVAGVLRSMVTQDAAPPPREAVEQALTKLVVNFVRPAG